MWPYSSLICLKLSRSRTARLTDRPRAAHAGSIFSTLASKPNLFSKPVRASWVAEYRSRRANAPNTSVDPTTPSAINTHEMNED